MSNQKVVVLGGYGTFGSLISSEIAKSTNVTIAGRNRDTGQKFADSINADFSWCDAKDDRSLRNTIAGTQIVIKHRSFLPERLFNPKVCIENCHYIDLADDREYVKNFSKINRLAKRSFCLHRSQHHASRDIRFGF
jgi:saccharopine dehydrogenase-like NADP-dependent oxidoreductase